MVRGLLVLMVVVCQVSKGALVALIQPSQSIEPAMPRGVPPGGRAGGPDQADTRRPKPITHDPQEREMETLMTHKFQTFGNVPLLAASSIQSPRLPGSDPSEGR
jgi:hypothetical protein